MMSDEIVMAVMLRCPVCAATQSWASASGEPRCRRCKAELAELLRTRSALAALRVKLLEAQARGDLSQSDRYRTLLHLLDPKA